MLHNSSWERGVRICERNSPADTNVSEKGEGGGAPGTGEVQPVVKTVVTQVVSLQSMEVHSGANIHPAACEGLHTGAGGCALKEATAHGKPTQEQVFWQDL